MKCFDYLNDALIIKLINRKKVIHGIFLKNFPKISLMGPRTSVG